MAKKPITALVMHPVVYEQVLREDHLTRLGDTCRLLAATPYRTFEELGDDRERLELIITSWGCPLVDEATVRRMPKLKLIAHLAGSVRGFLDDAVWRQGILVTNAVAANAVPVAEYTLAAILFANKQVFQLNRFYLTERQNRAPWVKEAPRVGNYRKVVGIVGASHVGRLVMEYLKPHDIRVLVYDPFVAPLEARDLGAMKVGLSELMSQSDVVSLHAPLLPETKQMIGARELALLRDGATLINTARGALIDQDALVAELRSGRLFAVLDTTEPSELPADSELFEVNNLFLTPNIAGSLGNEVERLSDLLTEEIERYVRGAALKHIVRRDQLPRLA